jgi:hypothetical protein
MRLKDAAEQSASNPRDEVSWDSDGIKNLRFFINNLENV